MNHNEVCGWKRSNVQVCNEMLTESIVKVFVFFFCSVHILKMFSLMPCHFLPRGLVSVGESKGSGKQCIDEMIGLIFEYPCL